MTRPLTVLLVDDDPLVRQGLSMMLGGSPQLQIIAEASDGAQAVELAREHVPDVVLMDIRMPVMDGLAATAVITEAASCPKVLVLTTFDTDDAVVTALRSGASGFLLKDTPPAQIVEAVKRVAEGEPMFSPTVMRQLMAAATASTADPRRAGALAQLSTLTEREREIAVAIGRGLSNAEIGAELFLSVATVKAHVTRLFTKLDATNRVQIALLTHDAGLL